MTRHIGAHPRPHRNSKKRVPFALSFEPIVGCLCLTGATVPIAATYLAEHFVPDLFKSIPTDLRTWDVLIYLCQHWYRFTNWFLQTSWWAVTQGLSSCASAFIATLVYAWNLICLAVTHVLIPFALVGGLYFLLGLLGYYLCVGGKQVVLHAATSTKIAYYQCLLKKRTSTTTQGENGTRGDGESTKDPVQDTVDELEEDLLENHLSGGQGNKKLKPPTSRFSSEEMDLLTRAALDATRSIPEVAVHTTPPASITTRKGKIDLQGATISKCLNQCVGTGPIYHRFMNGLLSEGYGSVAELLAPGPRAAPALSKKKKKKQNKNGVDTATGGGAGPTDGRPKFEWCFHGTPSLDNVASICCQGFDTSRRSGQAHGPGEYMDSDCTYATSYHRGTGGIIMCLVILPREKSKFKSSGSIRVVNNPQKDSQAKNIVGNLAGAPKWHDGSLPTYCLPVLAFPAPSALRSGGIASALPPCQICRPAASSSALNGEKQQTLQFIGDRGTWESCSQIFSTQFFTSLRHAKSSGNRKFTVGQWEYDCKAKTQRNLTTNKSRQIQLVNASW